LDVPPLTDKLRSHFGCPTLQGAPLEDDGSVTGSQGSHFERRTFLYEFMTSGVLHGRRVSEFTLALLQGTGWYQANYTYAEPFFFGQGTGCDFLNKSCTSTGFNFDEFCTGSAKGCAPTGRGGGYCQSDTKTDGCRYYSPDLDYDCENPDASANSRFPTRETYGRGAGSRCFTGNLTTSSTTTTSSYTSLCFKFKCQGTGLNTTLAVTVGTTTATCLKESQIKVSGLYGYLNCPDPITYCNTVGKQYCPRNCMGRGTCVNNTCVCNPGLTGIDCSMRTAITA